MRMPFGKFKGVELGDLPDDYLAWLTTLHDLRDPLRSAVATEWGDGPRPPGDFAEAGEGHRSIY